MGLVEPKRDENRYEGKRRMRGRKRTVELKVQGSNSMKWNIVKRKEGYQQEIPSKLYDAKE